MREGLDIRKQNSLLMQYMNTLVFDLACIPNINMSVYLVYYPNMLVDCIVLNTKVVRSTVMYNFSVPRFYANIFNKVWTHRIVYQGRSTIYKVKVFLLSSSIFIQREWKTIANSKRKLKQFFFLFLLWELKKTKAILIEWQNKLSANR